MNTEELERSLRTEFESYLKGVAAGMRQDVSDFQKNFEADFEKHKAQLDEAFRDLSARIESDHPFDPAFLGSVVEHLRLARDEGAELAATAIGEAEKLAEETAPVAKFDQMRDAINEISSKTSQSEILTSLVQQAANFTQRGAFFIVKNDHLVGWKVFGKEGNADDAEVREVQFPLASDTILADAVNSRTTQEGSHGGHTEDTLFLEPLNFAQPDRMHAIPLVARGRGVAVLYADYGSEGVHLNAEALETLVRVAGMTVELLAATQTAVAPAEVKESPAEAYESSEEEAEAADSYEAVAEEELDSESSDVATAVDEEETGEISADHQETYSVEPLDSEENLQASAEETAETVEEEEIKDTAEVVEEYDGEVSYEVSTEESDTQEETEEISSEFAIVSSDDQEEIASVEDAGSFASVEESATEEMVDAEEVTYFEPEVEAEVIEPTFAQDDEEAVVSFDSSEDEEIAEVEAIDYASPVEETNGSSNGHAPVAEPVVEVATGRPAKSRFSDKNVDLPIEVADDERRLHNDARRFARLLVSEIKLYNEQKVTEGRELGDMYNRLRDAIDRSRDMYSKRVHPPVSSKFDYFHYELVTSLAEGDDAKLGANYPGAEV